MPYFLQRPVIAAAIQWTGDNLAEVEAWAAVNAPWATQFVQDDDVLSLPLNGITLQVGDYLTGNWFIAAADLHWYQEVPGADYIFTMEQDT